MKPKRLSLNPTFIEERRFLAEGYKMTAGVDEVGRGCLAGPVVAGAVILPHNIRCPWLKEVRDSKMLSPRKREYLFGCIREVALTTGIGVIEHDVIDSSGIVKASKMAMKLAVGKLMPPADSLLIDYLELDDVNLPQKGIVHGDALCYSIACASIVAKVARDRMMTELEMRYPGYGLCRHKGYATKEHWRSIAEKGLSPIHRLSFCHHQYRFGSGQE